MQVLTSKFKFNKLHGSGPRTAEQDVVFNSQLTQATVFLTGFDVAFSGRNDHHLGNLNVRLSADIDDLAPQRVKVKATYGLRDWSGEWDDDYEGEIFFTVVAE